MNDDQISPGKKARWGLGEYNFGGPVRDVEGFGARSTYGLPGITKGSVTIGRIGPKVGDRVTMLVGKKVIERIITDTNGWDLRTGELEMSTRPATPEDGPSNTKLIRRMRWSRRRHAVRHWFRWMPGVRSEDA